MHTSTLRFLLLLVAVAASSPNSASAARLSQTDNLLESSPNSISASESAALIAQTDNLLESVLSAADDDSLWTKAVEKNDVVVYTTKMDVKNLKYGRREVSTPTIKGCILINSSPRNCFSKFCDDSLVSRYNTNCVEIRDGPTLSTDTKVNWCCSAKHFPFKAREFVTVIKSTMLSDKLRARNCEFASVACNVEKKLGEKLFKRNDEKFFRSEILLSASIFMSVKSDPNKTLMLQMTQVGDLGGGKLAKSKAGVAVTNKLTLTAPVDFLKKFALVCEE